MTTQPATMPTDKPERTMEGVKLSINDGTMTYEAEGKTLWIGEEDWGALQTMSTGFLSLIASGQVDLNKLAVAHLAERGCNHNAKWIGFDRAKALFEVK